MFTVLIQCCDPEDKGCEFTCWLESGGEGSEEGLLNFRVDQGWRVETYQILGETRESGVVHSGDQVAVHFACPECAFKNERR